MQPGYSTNMETPDQHLADARKHADTIRRELAARDAAMLRARDAGATLVQIGEAVGMSHPGVKKALARVRGEG